MKGTDRTYNHPVCTSDHTGSGVAISVRKRLLSTPLFAVEHREYACPGGGRIARDIVVHPGAVVILPILPDGRIVLIRNYRYAVDRELWELPAGTRESGEEPIDTARRELEEETGYRAEKMAPFIEFYTSPGILSEKMSVFVASGLTFVGQRLEAGEKIVTEPLSIDEIRERLLAGWFSDGKTIAVLGSYLLGRQNDGST